MSSVRGGGFRSGRGRGSGARGASTTAPAGPSNTRGRGGLNNAPRGHNAVRGAGGRGTATLAARGRGGAARGNAPAQLQTFAPTGIGGIPAPTGDWAARQRQLTINREQEKKDAIAQGLMSDPDRAIALSEAITLVGTCQDMCPENERVIRAMRNELWDPEKDENGQADESRMVKRFKRSAAGDEVQLPSDLRPPHVLEQTCDYLFHELVQDDDALAKNHHFIWDRTRGIRNDFSVQQISRLEDMRIAIDCFERIARFHIISLHLLAKSPKPYETYSEQQDREQLDRTLLSLLQYYDDVRGRLVPPNEPEFRAYCIIFQLRDPIPDLEDRIQSWPKSISSDPRVRAALEIYVAACSTMHPEGPMETAKHLVAQQHWERFWSLIISKKVSYLMGCVAEVYFNLLRHMMLNAIVRTARRARPPKDGEVLPPNTDFKIVDLWYLFNFDDEAQLKEFVGRWGLQFEKGPDNVEYLDIRNVAGKNLPGPSKEGPKQLKSEIVEVKRHWRTVPAVIDGLNVRQAKDAGLVGLVAPGDEMMDGVGGEQEDVAEEQEEEGDSLFVPEEKPATGLFQSEANNATAAKPLSAFGSSSTPAFGNISTSTSEQPTGFSFGKPSPSVPPQTSIFAQPTAAMHNPFAKPLGTTEEPKATPAANPFSLLAQPSANKPAAPTNPFMFPPATATATAPTTKEMPSSSSQTTTFGLPTSGGAAANPFLSNPFMPKPEATTPKAEEVKTTPPKKNTGPFLEEDSPTSPSSSQKAENKPAPAAPPPAWSFPKTSDKPAATTTSGLPQPEAPTNLKPAPSQAIAPSSTTTNAPPTISTQNTSNNNAVGQSGPRRTSSSSSSASLDQHKPKKPSPLSNSFTASADTTSPQLPPSPDKPVVKFSSPPSKPPKVEPPPPDFESILHKLAYDFTQNPSNGVLKDFVEYTVKNTIEEVHQQIQLERAEEFRRNHLIRNLIVCYSAGCKKLSRKRKGREVRERRRRRHEESQSGESDHRTSHRSEDEEMLGRFWKSATGTLRRPHGEQARAGSKRPAAIEDASATASMNGQSRKRSRTSDHVDDRGRVAKPVDPKAEILRKSSFLGFALPIDAPNRAPTTKSTYFRMKAMGIAPRPTADFRGTKRPRAGSDASSDVPATRRRSSSSLDMTDGNMRDYASMPPPSVRSVRSKTNDHVDEILARVAAAREALNDGGGFMKKVVDDQEDLQRSLSASQSSNESPSMARARVEARLRRSLQSAADLTASYDGRDVPAYRLRQSRFLTAEQQASAVDRARAMRASRAGSRETSRPASRLSDVDTVVAAPAPQQPVAPSHSPAAQAKASIQTTTNGSAGTTQSPAKQAAAQTPSWGFGALASSTSKPQPTFGSQTTTASPAPNPFSQSSSFAPPPTNGNPFLQAISNDSFTTAPTQAPPGTHEPHDNTIPRSQIPEALSHTFGRSQNSAPDHANATKPSQLASQAISLLSDDEEDEDTSGGHQSFTAYGQQHYFANGTGNVNGTSGASRRPPPAHDDSGDEQPQPQAYVNPFSFLEDDVSDQEGRGEWEGESAEDAEDRRQMPDSYQYSDEDEAADEDGYQDDEMPNGHGGAEEGSMEEADIENYDDGGDDEGLMEDADGEEEEYDEEEEEYEYDTDEEDDGGGGCGGPLLNQLYNRQVQQGYKQPNPALQQVGNNAEEAIELSD